MNITQFPKHVESLKGVEKASARLQYMILAVTMAKTNEVSIRSFARIVHLSHTTVMIYIKRGFFSESSAKHIESQLKGSLKAEWLLRPLEV